MCCIATWSIWAIECAKHAKPTNPRSVAALATARAYLAGEATREELEATARVAAWAAARAAWAAWAAVRAAWAAEREWQLDRLVELIKEEEAR